jgi:predicted nucleotidyltransferase
MAEIDEFKSRIDSHRKELEDEYFVKDIGLFGSYIKGKQDKGSDLDILVEFSKPISLFTFTRLQRYLSQLLGVEVDLVMRKALKPRIGERILSEVVYV